MLSSFFIKNQIKLNEIDSTSKFLLDLYKSTNIDAPVVVTADYQSKGKGRESKSWESEKGKNLLISVLLEHKISLQDQFKFSVIISLAIVDFLSIYIKEGVSIKWPNDIMINDKKIAGFIIENIVKNTVVYTSVLGVGVNINQKIFNVFSPLATSISLENNIENDLIQIKEDFLSCLEKRYKSLNTTTNFLKEYNDLLYKKNKNLSFEINKKKNNARIVGVDDSGKLNLRFNNKKVKKFSENSIRFLL